MVDVDLRWGVTEEEAEQGKVIEICLDEIENCKPFFGILGNRYDGHPIDTKFIIASLYGTLAKHTKPTLQPNFAKEPFSPSRSNAGMSKQIENNRQCLTANYSP